MWLCEHSGANMSMRARDGEHVRECACGSVCVCMCGYVCAYAFGVRLSMCV